eukprot:6172927-Pleurochrysis_carterae.AAC.2
MHGLATSLAYAHELSTSLASLPGAQPKQGWARLPRAAAGAHHGRIDASVEGEDAALLEDGPGCG